MSPHRRNMSIEWNFDASTTGKTLFVVKIVSIMISSSLYPFQMQEFIAEIKSACIRTEPVQYNEPSIFVGGKYHGNVISANIISTKWSSKSREYTSLNEPLTISVKPTSIHLCIPLSTTSLNSIYKKVFNLPL